jgi:hypothetical protein
MVVKPCRLSKRQTRLCIVGSGSPQSARRPFANSARRIDDNALSSQSSDGTCGTITRLAPSASSRSCDRK